MTITTDAQAEAARKVLDSTNELYELVRMDKEFKLDYTALSKLQESLDSALSAYEAQKAANIVLSEDAITVLKFAVIDSNAPFEELRMHGLIWKGSTVGITDAGRAYLSAQKPRKLKWEVWCKTYERDEPQEAQIGLFRTNVWAEHLRMSLEKAFPYNTYEVREVRLCKTDSTSLR